MGNPIHSMTGFGLGSVGRDGYMARVEIRSVNHRGRKLSVRSRPGLGPYEKTLRDTIAAALKRGMIDVYVTLVRPVDPERPPINTDIAVGAVAAIRHLAMELNLPKELAARDLVHIPGLFETGVEDPVGEADWPYLEEALTAALAQTVAMRAAEGAATAARMGELVQPLADFAAFARERAPRVVERARERLTTRLAELRLEGLNAGDEGALEREVCLFADRADINEEMDRLASHLEQYAQHLAAGGEIGKRLEFLGQEFLREVNTTASKANDAEIVTQAIEAKLAAEQIKEQAANLE